MVTPLFFFPNGGLYPQETLPVSFPEGEEKSLRGLTSGELAGGVSPNKTNGYDLLLNVFKQDYMFRQAIRSKRKEKKA